MLAYNIKINRLTAPMGIDAGNVLVSWICEGGVKQTAYRVKFENKSKLLFDSGVVSTSDMFCRPGYYVPSRTKVDVTVSLCDENGAWCDDGRTYFETGIAKDEWSAEWIDPELVHPEYTRLAIHDKPLNKASYLKKEFELDELGDARLYITAHGVYNAYINGTEVDGFYMAPGTSDYENRLQVQTYDVTAMLKPGRNEIIVTVGEGWWRGSIGWGMFRYTYGTQIALLCQLEIDGKPVVVSDSSWSASQSGPLEENDTMRIERYNANNVINDWHEVTEENFGFDNLIGTEIPITKHETFKAKLLTMPNGQKVLDFGQNFAGYVELDLNAHKGDFIRLTHGEVFGADGNFQNDNFQNKETAICRQVIEYTCKEGRNVYHQTKCYYGFRYVLVETDIPITGDEFTGVAVYSDMVQTSFFECGIPDVNRLFENVIWSMKSNFVDVPTDCPHREKLGFTGDCQVFSGAALYMMDAYPVLRRWLRESVSCQAENGCILYIAPPYPAPHKPVGKDGSAGWSSSMTIVPERFLHYHASVDELREFYPAIKKWIIYNLERAKAKSRPENEKLPGHIRDFILDCADNWGEWCEPGKISTNYFKEAELTGHADTATAFLAYDCYLAREIAAALGEEDDVKFFYENYQKVKAAFRYVYTDNGRISSDRQCHYIRPVAHKLLDGDEIQLAVDTLADMIKANGSRIGTGFLTTCHLGETLTDNGHSSTVYDLLLQREQPSWLFEISKGATTIWESWFGIREDGTPKGSHNHYSLGAITGWMMSRALGITAYDGNIVIRPYPDERLGYAKGSYTSPFGKIRSLWKYTDSAIEFEFDVPANADAEIILPNGEKYTVSTGKHRFSIAR